MSGLWKPGDPIPEGQDLDEQFKGLGLDFEDEGGNHDDGPSIRLLRCTQCRSLEILPDYVGDPHYDVVLDDATMTHQKRHPYNDVADAFLMRVSQYDWDRHKKTIVKKIWSDQEKHVGFIPEYYDTKSTYNEDAVKCFDQHHRSIPCIDWHVDRKRIGNPTKEGWKSGPRVYLCDFCPVAAKVQQAKNKARGLE